MKLDPCDFCDRDLPYERVTATLGNRTLAFCDEKCRDAFKEELNRKLNDPELRSVN